MLNSETRLTSANASRAQLSIVEHALCPLDLRHALSRGLTFSTGFNYTDKHRNRKRAQVQVAAVHGLSASDDLYLWGLLGLAFAQPEPSPDFQATPYWCLKQLGIIHPGKKGSEEFRMFREALRRLAGVRYTCDAFYDPLRHEHREVSFGFLSYSLPLSDGPARAWRFAWDPIFWELCAGAAGSLRFDLQTYRQLSPAARRLYLLLKKLFWRSDRSPDLEIRELGINVLGFSATLPTKEIKRKIGSCVDELLQRELVQLGVGQASADDCISKKGKGVFTLQMHRGPKFDQVTQSPRHVLEDSPLWDPLVAIGFDRASIARILKQYPAKLVQLWSDITLAAGEQKRIGTSPQAFFHYYLRRAADGRSTPPDWWRDIERQRRKEEHEQRRARAGIRFDSESELTFQQYIEGEAHEAFHSVMLQLKADLVHAGRSAHEAEDFAKEQALLHFRNKFRQERTGDSPWSRIILSRS